MNIHGINAIPLSNQRILLRADLNVPLDGTVIRDDYRLQAIIPTINALLRQGCKIILATHLGHPHAHTRTNYFDPDLSTNHLLSWFTKRGYTIELERDLLMAQKKSFQHQGSILLLENLRFFNGETEFNSTFAGLLATLADVYVNDAFSLCHRNDTSITLLPQQFVPEKRCMGLRMEQELNTLSSFKENPSRTYVMLLGGKKTADKIKLLLEVLTLEPHERPQHILLGGALANTFIKAQGSRIGISLVDDSMLEVCQQFLTQSATAGITVHLPTDFQVCMPNGAFITSTISNLPINGSIVDIGPDTIETYRLLMVSAARVFANGTMGIYEHPETAHGTQATLQAIADCQGSTIIGGGDAIAAVNRFNLQGKIDFMSTGGGATLAFLTSKKPFETLPGLAALE